jgi:hypothetical protein
MSYFAAGRALFQNLADVGYSSGIGAEATLYLNQLEAKTSSVTGERVVAEYGGVFAANFNNKILKVSFAGEILFDTGAVTLRDVAWLVRVTIIRTGVAKVKAQVSFYADGAAVRTNLTEISGLNLDSGGYDLRLLALADDSDDIIARYALGCVYPAVGVSPAVVRTNFALSSNGATATGYNTTGVPYSNNNFPSYAINGVRHTNNDFSNNGWRSADFGYPQTLEVDFGQPRTINEINVFTLANAVDYNTEPTLADTFTSFGIIAFTVDYWNGAAWVNIATVTGNNKVWRQFLFSSTTTNKIRVQITQSSYAPSVIVELEAWG